MIAILLVVAFTGLLKGFYDFSKINYKDPFIDVCMEIILTMILHIFPAYVSLRFLDLIINV